MSTSPSRQGVSHQLKRGVTAAHELTGSWTPNISLPRWRIRTSWDFSVDMKLGIRRGNLSCAWIVSDVLLDEVWSAFDVAFLPQRLCYWESLARTFTENSLTLVLPLHITAVHFSVFISVQSSSWSVWFSWNPSVRTASIIFRWKLAKKLLTSNSAKNS